LNAVITISEVVHRLELFVDNSDAGFVGSAGDFLDIRCGLAQIGKFFVDVLRSFNSGLGVEFSCNLLVKLEKILGWLTWV
jgi:hypothetical protein